MRITLREFLKGTGIYILGVCLLAIAAAGMVGLISLASTPAEAQPIGMSTDQIVQRIAYDGTNRILYVGECLPRYQHRGSSTVWRIKQFTYDGVSTRITAVTWANRSSNYAFAWNLRATYTY